MRPPDNRSALVLEGGGMRGVFSAGVLNAFGKLGFDPFDLYIGVSAGACNLASHLAGQNERNFDIISSWSSTRRFIDPLRFLRGGHYMDLDWLWYITIREYRLDLGTLFSSLQREGKEFIVVATSMADGRAMYLRPDENSLEHYLKVSSSLPVLYRRTLGVGNEPATDGGIADPIPVIEAYRRGAKSITVIRSRPVDYEKKRSRLAFLFSWYFRKYPHLARAYERRHLAYMEALDFIENPPKGVLITQIAPPDTLSISRSTRNMDVLRNAYDGGIERGRRVLELKFGNMQAH